MDFSTPPVSPKSDEGGRRREKGIRSSLTHAATCQQFAVMKTYENKLDEMIEVTVGLVWSCTIFRALFAKKDADREANECEARKGHPHFFITIHNSMLRSFFVTADLLFHADKKGKATSLRNLIREVEAVNPDLAKKLNAQIHDKRILLKKIGILRNEACAHLWEAKTQQEVFAEADVQLNMMTEVADLAQIIICELADDAGGNRRENVEQLKLNRETLQFIEGDAGLVMNALIETL